MPKPLASTIITTVLMASVTSLAFGEVFVFRHASRFDVLTQAPAVPIPDSAITFPGTLCGGGDRGPTGSGPQIQLAFGTNTVTITSTQGNGLCLFDAGTLIGPPGNTEPAFMIANTIVGDGEDDFHLVFDRPVQAVGLRFLTNNMAHEVLTFKDIAGGIIDTVNIDRFTPRNDRAFVGFISVRPIKEILIDTVGGAQQNEGIEVLKVAETATIPSALVSEE